MRIIKMNGKEFVSLGIGALIGVGIVKLGRKFMSRENPQEQEYIYVARISEHIQDDIERNWSSWNYGLDGFEGTRDEFESYLDQCREDGEMITLSGFEIFPEDFGKFEFGELYDDYWVAIDYRNGKGLSCNKLPAETREEAIEQVKSKGFSVNMGDGDTVDCSDAEVIYSEDELHVLEVPI